MPYRYRREGGRGGKKTRYKVQSSSHTLFVSSPKVRAKLVESVETNGLRQTQAAFSLLFGEDIFIFTVYLLAQT